MTMLPSPQPEATATAPSPLQLLQDRIERTVNGLMKTREQVANSLDLHLSELQNLKAFLQAASGTNEAPAVETTAAPVAVTELPAEVEVVPSMPSLLNVPLSHDVVSQSDAASLSPSLAPLANTFTAAAVLNEKEAALPDLTDIADLNSTFSVQNTLAEAVDVSHLAPVASATDVPSPFAAVAIVDTPSPFAMAASSAPVPPPLPAPVTKPIVASPFSAALRSQFPLIEKAGEKEPVAQAAPVAAVATPVSTFAKILAGPELATPAETVTLPAAATPTPFASVASAVPAAQPVVEAVASAPSPFASVVPLAPVIAAAPVVAAPIVENPSPFAVPGLSPFAANVPESVAVAPLPPMVQTSTVALPPVATSAPHDGPSPFATAVHSSPSPFGELAAESPFTPAPVAAKPAVVAESPFSTAAASPFNAVPAPTVSPFTAAEQLPTAMEAPSAVPVVQQTVQATPAPVVMASPFEPVVSAAPVSPFSMPEPATSVKESLVSPELEQATLEELNAALAKAFSQVSAKPAATPFVPAPVAVPELAYR